MTIRKRYTTSQGWELERFADLLDACGKNGYRSLGLALCLGDAQPWTEALTVEKEYKQKLLAGLQALEQGGIHETEGLRYFYTENSSLGGVIAGIAVNFLYDEKKPLFLSIEGGKKKTPLWLMGVVPHKYIYDSIVNDNSDDLQEVKVRRYQFLSAMLGCVMRNADKNYISREVIKKIIDVLVQNNFIAYNKKQRGGGSKV
jgi:hypothetical protein